MRKNILISLILIFSFLITAAKAQEELQPIDYSIPVAKAAAIHQKAALNGDSKTFWRMLTKKMQEFYKNYATFEKAREDPRIKKANLITGNARMIGIRFITANRAWIKISGPGVLPAEGGFYFIKEDGEWKYAGTYLYFNQAKKDIDFIGKAIKDYYQANKKLPNRLSDLNISIPLDVFNDNNELYVYKIIDGTKCMLYSFGPNSKDDNGAIEIDWSATNITPLTVGDIVWSFSP